ncbi:MAG: cell wall hydrolase [Geminicoccaceae bacterium]|nr:cell wall hydrolase [Geminicoccaceae bacterium]MCB9943976.1 cell wall hydrolase [Geminicoccaceae bacterium]
MVAGEARTILEAMMMLFAVHNPDPAAFEKQVTCMARNIWFEARGSAFADKLAVGQVVLNRVADPRYDDTPCKVIWDAHQFSWTHDGLSDNVRIRNAIDRQAWTDSVLAALTATTLPDLTGGATSFHAVTISPSWSNSMHRVAQYGGHVYYTSVRSIEPEWTIEPAARPQPPLPVSPRQQVEALDGLDAFWTAIDLAGPGSLGNIIPVSRPESRFDNLLPIDLP